ncbi:methylated-DNA--[protein]-cysteine S-methyltransferase [Candidatus Magnetomonas plexicatena]|uniref:methylated-DNA--[protein]-cysteine S-methyltransferase n=1 Tax=Candidatus Magnetomonas plexicatena TaxID=2552947 RepID=UPI001C74964F|nr:methylated-DNA--[protein]-cysteine S-methyltransferase [Nitrospirales bacterium LBB_01]
MKYDRYFFDYLTTQFGRFFLIYSDAAITGTTFTAPENAEYKKCGLPLFSELNEYFCGKRREFTQGLINFSDMTPFRRSVYNELLRVPFGEVITYGGLARRVGKPSSARAVGQAMRVNPFPILIPCHRVIGSSGSLGGYSEGIDIKIKLLEFEKKG